MSRLMIARLLKQKGIRATSINFDAQSRYRLTFTEAVVHVMALIDSDVKFSMAMEFDSLKAVERWIETLPNGRVR